MRPARDPYEVLGVARDATGDDIRRAFRALAGEHPDKHPEDPEGARARFAEITEAHAILSDEIAHGQYDRAEPPYHHEAGDPGDLIPPDVVAVASFVQEVAPEVINAFRTVATDEPFMNRIGRVGRAAVQAGLDAAKTPEGQAQIRDIAQGVWTRFLKLDKAPPP